MTDDGGKFVIEPCPALVICTPWPSRLTWGQGSLDSCSTKSEVSCASCLPTHRRGRNRHYGRKLGHHSRRRRMRPLGPDSRREKKEEQEQRTCCGCAVDRAWVRWTGCPYPSAPHGEVATLGMRLPPWFMHG